MQWRSQVTDDARALHTFDFFRCFCFHAGGGHCGHTSLVNCCILEVATHIVLETILKCRRS